MAKDRSKRAADLVRERNLRRAMRDAKGRSRVVGAQGGQRQFGLELQEARQAGLPIPGIQRPRPPADPAAARKIMVRQAKSTGFLEELRRRLAGAAIGSPIRTKEDVERRDVLSQLAGQLSPELNLAKRREAIAKQLTGRIGFLGRALLRAKQIGLAAESLFGKAREQLRNLSRDALQRQFGGFKLLPESQAARDQIRAPGFRRTTPYQSATMIGVSSSNVASVGWEPHDPDEERVGFETLGTLFIQFTNGWLYKYVNCPNKIYQAILRAPSKGKAVWTLLRRGLYPDGIPYGSAAREGYERIL